MPSFLRISFRLGLSGALLGWSAAAYAAPTAGPSRSDSLFDLAGDIHGAAFGFFNPVTGERTAILRVGRIGREFGRQGPFRVAWKPRVVLENVLLQIDDEAAWPRAARQFLASLPARRLAGVIVIRGFRLRIDSRRRTALSSALARLSPEGDLELTNALLTASGRSASILPSAVIPLVRPTPAVWSIVSSSAFSLSPTFNPPVPCAPQPHF